MYSSDFNKNRRAKFPMSIIEKLKPISKEHSIKEATISVILVNPINDPPSFKALLDNELKDKFTEFGLLEEKSIHFENDQIHIGRNETGGFRLAKIEDKNITSALQGRNEPNRSFFSFHTLKYSGWENVLEEFLSVISIVGDFQGDLIVKAFSLHYVNQFLWDSEDNIDFASIFRPDSKILPDSFFDSKTNIYTWIKEIDIEGLTFFERLEIGIDYRLDKPLLTISNNTTRQLTQNLNISDLLHKEKIRNLLEKVHSYSKETLKDLLHNDVQSLINLNK